MKIELEVDVELGEVLAQLVESLESKSGEKSTAAASEIIESTLPEFLVEMHKALIDQESWNWNPAMPAEISEAREALVQAAGEILEREEIIEELKAEEEEEEEEEEDEDEDEDEDEESAVDATADHFNIDYQQIAKSIENRISETELGELNERSLLKIAGYTVGKTNGLPPDRRRGILKAVMHMRSNVVRSQAERARFGSPNSEQRKMYIINLLKFNIGTRTKTQERYGHDFQQAIDDWKDDLAWINKQLKWDTR